MQQLEQGVQHGGQHRGGVLNTFGELHFRQFDVPVAELVPGEVVQRLAGSAELVAVERRIHFGANLFHPAQHPAVGVGQVGGVGQRRWARRH